MAIRGATAFLTPHPPRRHGCPARWERVGRLRRRPGVLPEIRGRWLHVARGDGSTSRRAWSHRRRPARHLRVRGVNLETLTTYLDEHHCYRSQSLCGGASLPAWASICDPKSWITAARMASLRCC